MMHSAGSRSGGAAKKSMRPMSVSNLRNQNRPTEHLVDHNVAPIEEFGVPVDDPPPDPVAVVVMETQGLAPIAGVHLVIDDLSDVTERARTHAAKRLPPRLCGCEGARVAVA